MGTPGHHQGLNRRTAGRVAVIQHLAPKDAGSPLHVHHRENEWFYVPEGELTIWADGQVIRAPAGSFVFGSPGHAAHLHDQLRRRRPLLAGHRAGRFRGLHARPCRARPGTYPAAARRPPPRANDRHRRRIRHRHPRAARHPSFKGGKQDGYRSRNFGVQAPPKAARLMPEIASVDTNTEHDVLRR
jgi:hypothetical protein